MRTWDPASLHAVGVIPAETGPGSHVNAVAFSPDGKLLATANGDGTVGLWNPVTVQASGGFSGRNGVAFSPDGTLLATADADGTVRTWQMPLFANSYAVLCADAGPPTEADWTHYAPGEPQPSVCR